MLRWPVWTRAKDRWCMLPGAVDAVSGTILWLPGISVCFVCESFTPTQTWLTGRKKPSSFVSWSVEVSGAVLKLLFAECSLPPQWCEASSCCRWIIDFGTVYCTQLHLVILCWEYSKSVILFYLHTHPLFISQMENIVSLMEDRMFLSQMENRVSLMEDRVAVFHK